jgi:hypothetical protein
MHEDGLIVSKARVPQWQCLMGESYDRLIYTIRIGTILCDDDMSKH